MVLIEEHGAAQVEPAQRESRIGGPFVRG
jgi:hypothetical protein